MSANAQSGLTDAVGPGAESQVSQGQQRETAAGPSIQDPSQTVMETLRGIMEDFLAHLPLLVAGAFVLLLTLAMGYAARWIAARALRGVRLRESLQELIIRFAVIGVWSLGLMIAAMVTFPGLTPTKALTALGIGSIAIGLAFKDIFENFFAGVLILWRFPFEPGDWITCTGITGRVVNVTTRNTILRTVRGELVVLPNVDLYKNPVDILTNKPSRRIEVIAGVAYGEDVDASRSVIRKAVESCETVDNDPAVQVFALEFASSSINFEVAWWTGSTPLEQRESRDEVVAAIKRALDEAGIEIPFPYRTLTFKHPLSIERNGPNEGEDRD